MQPKGHDEDDSLRQRVERGDALLLLAPSLHAATEEACIDFLTPVTPRESNVLWITYTRTQDSCMQDYLSRTGERPENARVVTASETTRSASAQAGDDATPALDDEIVENLSDPGDLTALGIKLSEILKEWDVNGNDTFACFDSLTALLQYADLQTAYKFLHVLTGRFEAADVTAHFHLDPEACDEQTVGTLTSLFDAVVELDDGEWVVRGR